ncbi:N-6 DNA methylase [Clostridium perfringens]|nr:N-6 DNA methylase [Clostridium perfringens]
MYEKFKDKDEKEELGQYYTKRHISKVLAQITLKPYINKIKKEINDLENQLKETGDKITPQQIIDIIIKNYKNIKIIDPSCGTGGLLTECYAYFRRRI